MSRILLVDDEEHVLRAVARVLRGHEIETASSAEEALALADSEDFALVVADYRMPGMNGVSMFKRLKELQPDTVRIILTAYADLDGMQAAVNEAEVFRFVNKPWSDFELRNAVETGLAHSRALLENRKLADQVRQQQAQLDQQAQLLQASPGSSGIPTVRSCWTRAAWSEPWPKIGRYLRHHGHRTRHPARRRSGQGELRSDYTGGDAAGAGITRGGAVEVPLRRIT